jgi:hypothetical protein
MSLISQHQRLRAGIKALGEFAAGQDQRDHCELCGDGLEPEHRHRWDIEANSLVYLCMACAERSGNHTGVRFEDLPRMIVRLSKKNTTCLFGTGATPPIRLAFLTRQVRDQRLVARFPGPIGLTDFEVDPTVWQEFEGAHPSLRGSFSHLTAYLINQSQGASEHYFVPIDVGFRLAGLVRFHWRGFFGGVVLWNEVARFFEQLERVALREESFPVGTNLIG